MKHHENLKSNRKKDLLSVAWENKYLLLILIIICLPADDLLLYWFGRQYEGWISGSGAVIACVLFFLILKWQKKI